MQTCDGRQSISSLVVHSTRPRSRPVWSGEGWLDSFGLGKTRRAVHSMSAGEDTVSLPISIRHSSMQARLHRPSSLHFTEMRSYSFLTKVPRCRPTDRPSDRSMISGGTEHRPISTMVNDWSRAKPSGADQPQLTEKRTSRPSYERVRKKTTRFQCIPFCFQHLIPRHPSAPQATLFLLQDCRR